MFHRSQRLFLRPGWIEDAADVAARIGDETIVRNLQFAPWPYSEQDARDWLESDRHPKFPAFVIALPDASDGSMIGACGFHAGERGLELGYWIARQWWGRGFATEAVGSLLRLARLLGHSRVYARHAADNPPAERPRGWTDEMMHHHFFPNAAAALEELEKCVRKYNGALGGRARCWVNIEGKEPCTLELHVGARSLAERLGVGTTYHLATSIEEAKVCEGKYGVWPVTRIDKANGLGRNLVIAHCAAVQDEEVELLARRGVKVAFCPCSSFKLGKGATAIGKYPEMVAAGVTVGLGTDGVAAAGNMNLMRQMPLVAGMSELEFWPFMIANAASAVIWAYALLAPGAAVLRHFFP